MATVSRSISGIERAAGCVSVVALRAPACTVIVFADESELEIIFTEVLNLCYFFLVLRK